jgi:hypothetical protein
LVGIGTFYFGPTGKRDNRSLAEFSQPSEPKLELPLDVGWMPAALKRPTGGECRTSYGKLRAGTRVTLYIQRPPGSFVARIEA